MNQKSTGKPVQSFFLPFGHRYIAYLDMAALQLIHLFAIKERIIVAKRSKTPAQIKAEMAKLSAELKQAEAREGERIGAIAIKAGLHEIDVSDADLTQAFKDIAARFQSTKKEPKPTA